MQYLFKWLAKTCLSSLLTILVSIDTAFPSKLHLHIVGNLELISLPSKCIRKAKIATDCNYYLRLLY